MTPQHRSFFWRRSVALLAVAMLAGCAGLTPVGWPGADTQTAQCLRAFAEHDAQIAQAGVGDAEAARVPGFGFLRVDRFSAALASRAGASDAAFEDWLQRLRRLDDEARAIEARAAGAPAPTCAAQLLQALRADPQARARLRDAARVPERYSSAARMAGVYALTRIPFFAGVRAWQRDQVRAMQEAAARPRPSLRWGPALAPASVPRPTLRGPQDALGLPRLESAAAEALLAEHAPLFEIEAEGAYDHFGMPRWQASGVIGVDTDTPVVYQRLAHTLVQGEPLVQLVYTVWFPERPKRNALDLLGGVLDGLIVRITLAPDGRPLLVDTIHACGCYHLFFPAARLALRPDPPVDEEWAFVPATLPAWQPGDRFAVRVASATHHVIGLTSVPSAAPDTTASYQRRTEAQLRQLPTPEGGVRSLYAPDGLVAGTERGERYFFWPMGIASAGAMRQWGHHATAFVGRRHFDDADLIDRRFVINSRE